MSTCDDKPQPDEREHPIWCAKGATGLWHRSAEYAITPDERSGVSMQLVLTGKESNEYVEVTFTTYDGVPPHPLLPKQTTADACCDPVAWPGIAGDGKSTVQNPPDPYFVTDPHAHDLTLRQAGELYRALGELLTLAHGQRIRSVPMSSNGGKSTPPDSGNVVPIR